MWSWLVETQGTPDSPSPGQNLQRGIISGLINVTPFWFLTMDNIHLKMMLARSGRKNFCQLWSNAKVRLCLFRIRLYSRFVLTVLYYIPPPHCTDSVVLYIPSPLDSRFVLTVLYYIPPPHFISFIGSNVC
jgi:hypothetical protein